MRKLVPHAAAPAVARLAAALLAAMLIGSGSGPVAAQTAARPQPQPRAQLPDDQRPSPAETNGRGGFDRGETGVGEQSGRPIGDAFAKPAAPDAPTQGGSIQGESIQGQSMKPTAGKGDTTATSAKAGASAGGGLPQGKSAAERHAPQPGEGGDRSYPVIPDQKQPVKRPDDPNLGPTKDKK